MTRLSVLNSFEDGGLAIFGFYDEVFSGSLGQEEFSVQRHMEVLP